MRCASARINHGPCQILWERKCQRAACHYKEKLKWQQHLQWQEKIRKRSLETNSPLCDHDNAKIPTHLLPRIITSSICIILESLQSASTGCLLSDGFYLSLECVDSSDVKPSNSPALACLSRPVSLPNWSHGHGSHPLGCDLLPLNGLPPNSLKNGKS